MSLWSKAGKFLKGAVGFLGKGISFVGRGIGKGLKAVKKAVFGVAGAAFGASTTLLGRGRKTEAEGRDAQRGIEETSKAGDKKVEGVKAETQKMADAPPPRPDPEAEADKREARAEGEAAKHKLDAMEAGVRAMDKLSSRTVEILRKYGSNSAKDMVAGMDMRKPNVSTKAGTDVLLGEQIRLMYEQKFNHRHGVYSILSMVGAGNELLGVLSDQLRLIHAQGVTDANYDVIKSKVMETLATKAVADSIKANAVADKGGIALQDSLNELVALQKEGNVSQEAGTRPLLKKMGLGMMAGLAGLAGLMLASKYMGKPDGDQEEDKKEDDGDGWDWDWTKDASEERDDEEDRKNPDYIKDDGTLMTVEERNRVDEIKSEAAFTGGAMGAGTVIDGISAIKKGKAASTVTKVGTEVAGKAATRAITTEARKKFLSSLGPRALKVIGTKIATKLGIKAATKGALKKIPVAGLLFSLFEAVPRIANGDYTGAALALGSGAASLLHAADVVTGPGGTIAAISLGLAADGALALHDYNKAMDDLKTKGYSDLLDDDDLADVFVTPTEEEMKAADEAEAKVNAEQSVLGAGLGSSKGTWGKVKDMAAGVGQIIMNSTGMFGQEDKDKEGSESEGGMGSLAFEAASALFPPLAMLKGASKFASIFKAITPETKWDREANLRKAAAAVLEKARASAPPALLAGRTSPQGSASSPQKVMSAHEVSHETTGTWMGYGAKGDYDSEGMGDLSSCRSYPPETMERITNFEAYPPNEIDEEGDFNDDVQGMIRDLVGMQGTIKYSMEQRDIDKGIGDCSTFTRWAMKKYFGIDIGGNCDMQLGENLGKVVDYSGVGINGETSGARGPNMSVLKPGDLIYYSSSTRPWNAGRPFRIAHVEMYIGGGKVIGQTTRKGHGKGTDPKGPWVHDINDPNLGTFLAAKRYIGQTQESAKYAVDPSSVGVSQAQPSKHGTKDSPRPDAAGNSFGRLRSILTNAVQSYASAKQSVSAPTHTPTSSASQGQSASKAQVAPDSAQRQGNSPVAIDNSTVNKGGDTYITNNTTTNIYTHEDGRGDSELS